MIKVETPWNNNGELLIFYKGDNRVIYDSINKITCQKIKLLKRAFINNTIEERCCLEFILLNKKYLLVLDGEKLYEIIQEGEQKTYAEVPETYIFVRSHKEAENKYVVHGQILTNFRYNEQAEFQETFIFQINLFNQLVVRDLFEALNED